MAQVQVIYLSQTQPLIYQYQKAIESENYFELAIINLSEMDCFLIEKYRLEAKKW